MYSWGKLKWTCIVIALIAGLLLTGISDSFSGYDSTSKILGFELGLLIGIACFASAGILYKKL